jgi:hypothetical protein
MALQKVKDSMRVTTALDSTKLADNSITLDHFASGTDGQVITYSAAGDPVAIGPGTAGQVLTSAGVNLPQTFADAGGGAWTLLGSINASSTQIAEFTDIDATYNTLVLVASEIVIPSDNKVIFFELGDDTGYSTGSALYCIYRWGISEKSSNWDDNGASASDAFGLTNDGLGNATGESCSGVWYINGTSSSSAYPTIHGESIIIENNSGLARKMSFIGQLTEALQITKLKILAYTTTILTGRISLYGIKHT